jgi:hypothetical protein
MYVKQKKEMCSKCAVIKRQVLVGGSEYYDTSNSYNEPGDDIVILDLCGTISFEDSEMKRITRYQ